MVNLGVVITGIGLGLAYAAAPGAVNTEAIRRGLTHGARSTLLIEFGSLLGDSLWALLALTGVAIFAQHLALRVVLGIAGGFFLLRMGWLALHSAIHRNDRDSKTQQASTRSDFATGIVFGLANPAGLAFWSGLGSSVVSSGTTGLSFALFFAGFFTGATLWGMILTVLLGWGRRWIRPTTFRWINALCGLALGIFGLRILWTTCLEWLESHTLQAMSHARFGT